MFSKFYDDHIGEDVKELIERGNITFEEWSHPLNSYERDAMVESLSDETLKEVIKINLKNVTMDRHFPPSTYEENLLYRLVPELMKRLEK